MTFAWFLKQLLAALLLPPGNGLLLLALAGLFRRRRWAPAFAVVGALLLFLQSLPPVAQALMASLERQAGPVVVAAEGAQAIVVLGGGLDADAPEYGGDTAGERTLGRLRYGAVLARRFELPVLVTGGQPSYASRAEADVMAEFLQNELAVAVRWRETAALDTEGNAAFSAAILHDAGVQRVLLVTDAFHMPRARELFERAGLSVVPAPLWFRAAETRRQGLLDWLPRASALRYSYYALHEWLGRLWLRLKVEGSPAR